jgi:uncharacterized protein YgbK (DUF1537 family)
MSGAAAPLYVIDDDPTGAQGQADVPLLLAWDGEQIEDAVRERPRALHLLTNSRALDPEGAYAIVRDAVEAVRSAVGDPRFVLRGDSTLRAHLLPEYGAVRDALWPDRSPPLLLVPALPVAGRVTRDGTHWLVRDGKRLPLERTEFATDGDFSYSTSHLTAWAEERSGGYFPAADGIEIGLEAIRSDGGEAAVAAALLEAGPGPAVVVPDAESVADLQTIAAGLARATAGGTPAIVRCAPTFASVLSGAGATDVAPLPAVERGLLVVVGSHVPMSTAQLEALNAARPGALVELDAAVLAGAGAATAIAAASDQARALLRCERLAIVATSRAVATDALGAESGIRVAGGLAAVVGRLTDAFDVLLSKGGITSAANVREGLGASRAQVVGPVTAGISLWRVRPDGGDPRPVIVFPGNVGGAHELADLVQRLIGD